VTDASDLVAVASAGDVRMGLRAAVALGRLADTLEALNVAKARTEGWSWEQIAEALGVSRQAVHKKYAGRLPMTNPKET